MGNKYSLLDGWMGAIDQTRSLCEYFGLGAFQYILLPYGGVSAMGYLSRVEDFIGWSNRSNGSFYLLRRVNHGKPTFSRQ